MIPAPPRPPTPRELLNEMVTAAVLEELWERDYMPDPKSPESIIAHFKDMLKPRERLVQSY